MKSGTKIGLAGLGAAVALAVGCSNQGRYVVTSDDIAFYHEQGRQLGYEEGLQAALEGRTQWQTKYEHISGGPDNTPRYSVLSLHDGDPWSAPAEFFAILDLRNIQNLPDPYPVIGGIPQGKFEEMARNGTAPIRIFVTPDAVKRIVPEYFSRFASSLEVTIETDAQRSERAKRGIGIFLPKEPSKTPLTYIESPNPAVVPLD